MKRIKLCLTNMFYNDLYHLRMLRRLHVHVYSKPMKKLTAATNDLNNVESKLMFFNPIACALPLILMYSFSSTSISGACILFS